MIGTIIFDMHLTVFRFNEADPNQIEPMPYALDTIANFYAQGYKIVIISTSEIQNSRDRLSFLLTEYGFGEEKLKEFFKKIDILSMQYFGSKHTKEAWLQAMKSYSNILYIFEDGEAKLHAAGEAAKELGSDPELFTSVTEFVES